MPKDVRLDRRSFTLGLTGALALTLLPTRARAGSGKVLILGGSTIHSALGKTIEETLQAAGLSTQRQAKSSSGLARPDFYDWPTNAKAYTDRFAPDAVVVMFGGNDGQALFMGEDASPKWIKWEEDGWSAEYRARVAAFADAVSGGGARIVWLGMPDMRSSKLNERMQRMNGIYEAEMNARKNGHYVSTQTLIPGVSGYADFAKIDGKEVRVRAEDGVHYSLHGAKIVAGAIAPQVVTLLGG